MPLSAPDYFGNVGSFSGTVNISSPDLEYGLSGYSDIWGPPGGFYELGHNPTQLIDNFRYTRVFMAVGNGQPLAPGDSSQQLAALAESELRREAADFRAAARSAHVDVHFVEHAGVHLQNNANLSLQDFLRYGPWRPTANSVATWRLSTVEQSGIAWGYHFSFARAPATIETFSYGGDTLTAAGSGDVALTSPTGRRYRASLPFTVSNGILHPGHGGSKSFAPTSLPVRVRLHPDSVGSRGAIQATFTSRRAPAGRIFVLLAFQAVKTSCFLNNTVRISKRLKPGRMVTVAIGPGTGRGHPRGRWCDGHGSIDLVTVKPGPDQLQTARILGGAAFKAR